MKTALLSIALLGVLLFALSCLVSYFRFTLKHGYGTAGDPKSPFDKAVRAQANSVDYLAMVSVIMLALGFTKPQAWVEYTMLAFVIGRYLTALAFLTTADLRHFNLMKAIGMGITYVSGIALCVALLVVALSHTNILTI